MNFELHRIRNRCGAWRAAPPSVARWTAELQLGIDCRGCPERGRRSGRYPQYRPSGRRHLTVAPPSVARSARSFEERERGDRAERASDGLLPSLNDVPMARFPDCQARIVHGRSRPTGCRSTMTCMARPAGTPMCEVGVGEALAGSLMTRSLPLIRSSRLIASGTGTGSGSGSNRHGQGV